MIDVELEIADLLDRFQRITGLRVTGIRVRQEVVTPYVRLQIQEAAWLQRIEVWEGSQADSSTSGSPRERLNVWTSACSRVMSASR